MLAKSYFQISGKLKNDSYFKFHESALMDFGKIHDVLTGNILGTITHDVITKKDCQTICNNFWNNKAVDERRDGVPAISIGAYHYKKKLDDYFRQVEDCKRDVDDLFSGTDNIVDTLISKFTDYFASKNIHFRLASHNDRAASKFVMRSCNTRSGFVISPHDDVAQCRTVDQKGFEIEKIPDFEMVAVNICLENHNCGELYIWNIQPDNKTRAALNIQESGYPYPPYLLVDFERKIIPIRSGDIYCFNGRNIHAVKSKIISDKYRTTITFFMGYIDDNTIIYWT